MVLDLEKKLRAYARAGVRHLWLVDLRERALEVYRLEERCWNRQRAWSSPATVHAEPFESLGLVLELLWAR